MANTRNQGLQALRGIAAMLVFVHHLPWLTNNLTGGTSIIQQMELGGAGVAIFFALSGYLMTHKVSLASPRKFLIDRIRRIYPSLWCALILAALISLITGGPFLLNAVPLTLLPVGKEYPTTVPYWTLTYEIGFYLLVFGALLLSKRPILIVTAFLVLSYTLAPRPYVWVDVAYPTWFTLAFSLMSVNFLAGILVGWLPKLESLLFVSAIGIAGAFLYWMPQIANISGAHWLDYPFIFTNDGAFPRFLKAVGCGLMVWSSISWVAGDRLSRIFVRLGDYSYGIYLLHVGAMFFAAYLLRSTAFTELPYYVVMTLVAVIAFPISCAFGWFDWKMQFVLRKIEQGLFSARSLKLSNN